MHAQPSRVREAGIGVEAIACTVIAFSKQIRRRLRIVVDGDVVKQQAGFASGCIAFFSSIT